MENHRPGPIAEARGSGPGGGCPCHLPFPVVESRMDGPLGLATLPDPSQSSSGWEGVISQRNYHQVPVTRRMLCRQRPIAVDCGPLPPSFRGNVSATQREELSAPFCQARPPPLHILKSQDSSSKPIPLHLSWGPSGSLEFLTPPYAPWTLAPRGQGSLRPRSAPTVSWTEHAGPRESQEGGSVD